MNLYLLYAIGPWQIAVIAVLILLMFGGKKIPELMRGLGKGVSEFKKGKDGEKEKKQDDEKANKNGVSIAGKKMTLHLRKPKTRDQRAKIVKEWYRKELKAQIPDLLSHWETIIGVKANDWGVKQMHTKWGACNVDDKRIWLNLELSKKPKVCLEYILVHELVHLHERHHNSRFIQLMNQFMPNWRLYRDQLNQLPVAHNDWGY